jgi:hypothetical protein
MPQVAILKITSYGQDCYECGGSRELQTLVNWQEVSDEDYSLLSLFISSQLYNSSIRYIMVEQCDYKDIQQSEDFNDILELAKQKEKSRLAATQRAKKQAEERVKRAQVKAQERKRQQFEQLKKELGEE